MITVVWESALRSLLLGGAVWLALKLFRVADPRARKLAWILVLLGSLAMPGLMQWNTLPLEANPAVVTHSIPAFVLPAANATVAYHAPARDWTPVGTAVYLAGAGILLLRLMLGLGIAWRLWRRGQPLAGVRNVRVSAATASPVTIGSGILLPWSSLEWDETQLRIVLAHERSHVRDGDFYWQFLAGLHACLFWFSPLGWWLKKELIEASEAVSDEAALREAGSACSYAELLLHFAAGPRGLVAGVAMARSDVRRRIHRILTGGSSFPAFTWKRATALVAMVVPLLIVAPGLSVRLRGQSSHYTSSHHNDSFVIISGDSTTMSGSSGDEELAQSLRSKISGDYVWFVRNGKAYFIDDPTWVKQAQALFKPQEELGRKQEELGAQQEKLGEQQEKLGELQSKVSVRLPAIDKELANLEAQLKRFQSAEKAEVTQDQLSELQSKIGDLQSKLGEAQSAAGEKQAALGEQQAKLGDEQAKLGDQQAALGDQQAKLAEAASRQINSMIDTALRSGKAHLAQ